MLSKQMVNALNKQINAEFYASTLYLQMSAWCNSKGLPGCAAFLGRQSAEETQHMMKLFRYVSETGALPLVGELSAPPAQFASVHKVFELTYQHEVDVTQRIYHLVETAQKEKDHSTYHFLQWYVAEQHEEENLFKNILDKFKLIGTDGRGLFFIDREIAELTRAK